MTFDASQYLWYLTAIPVIGLLLLVSSFQTRRTVRALTTQRQESRISAILTVKSFISSILISAVLASLILALAGPRWGEVSVEDERRGLEIVFLFDVSNSMAAQDILPSRLERSRETARTLVSRLPDALVSAVAFKGDAVPILPMTEDDVAFQLALAGLSGSMITSPGTNIENGLRAAIAAFPEGSARYRVVILFSDGEQIDGDVTDVLEQLRVQEIPVLVVAAGTAGGAVIPTVNDGVVRDAAGNPVLARVDLSALQEIADASDGTVYRLGNRTLLQELADELDRRSGVNQAVVFRRTRVERYHVFVSIAVLFLALSILVQNLRWRRTV